LNSFAAAMRRGVLISDIYPPTAARCDLI